MHLLLHLLLARGLNLQEIQILNVAAVQPSPWYHGRDRKGKRYSEHSAAGSANELADVDDRPYEQCGHAQHKHVNNAVVFRTLARSQVLTDNAAVEVTSVCGENWQQHQQHMGSQEATIRQRIPVPAGKQFPFSQAVSLLQVKPEATAKLPLLARWHMGDHQRL